MSVINDDLDLDLDNYELNDILALFNLKYNFTESDLKNAKKIALMTHPDKSNLDKKYFLFFTSAYKVIYSIHQFRTRSSSHKQSTSTKYVIENEIQRENENGLIKDLIKNKNFNKIFNELFEKHRLKDESADNGYGEWLKSTDDDFNNQDNAKSVQDMHSAIDKRKQQVKSIIVHRDFEDVSSIGSGQSSDIVSDRPEYYQSSLFSSLQYEDLKKAHIESVIPVTIEDYNNREKYKSRDDLKQKRDLDDISNKPLSLIQSRDFMHKKQSLTDQNDVLRAFKLAKQDEESRRLNHSWMSGFQQILYTDNTK
jgi:hypothetical protein